jgi:hypothetical protein
MFDTLYLTAGDNSNANFFSFIFEALRYFPELEQQMRDLQTVETNAWINVIDFAKLNGEIKSDMSSDTLAKLFIYTADGSKMDYVLDKDFEQLKARLNTLWYDIYELVKT